MTKFVVCDPGASGALAIMDLEGKLYDVIDMPMMKFGKGCVDARAIDSFVNDHDVNIAVIEDVWGQAGDSKKSIFTFGRNEGGLTAALAMSCNEIHYLTPRSWKGKVGLIGTGKKQSAIKAASVYGEDLFKGPRGAWKDGRGDAVMMGVAAIKIGVF